CGTSSLWSLSSSRDAAYACGPATVAVGAAMTKIVGIAMASCLVVSAGLAQATNYQRPKIQLPEPRGYVSDHAQAIDGDWKERIRSVCQDLERKTGIEMVVVI